MTHEQANRILDRTREGWEFSEFVVTRALELTGDYEPNGSDGVDSPLQEKILGGWQSGGLQLVD